MRNLHNPTYCTKPKCLAKNELENHKWANDFHQNLIYHTKDFFQITPWRPKTHNFGGNPPLPHTVVYIFGFVRPTNLSKF